MLFLWVNLGEVRHIYVDEEIWDLADVIRQEEVNFVAFRVIEGKVIHGCGIQYSLHLISALSTDEGLYIDTLARLWLVLFQELIAVH